MFDMHIQNTCCSRRASCPFNTQIRKMTVTTSFAGYSHIFLLLLLFATQLHGIDMVNTNWHSGPVIPYQMMDGDPSVRAKLEQYWNEPFSTVHNSSISVQRLFDLFKNVRCKRNVVTGTCVRGTVHIDPWLSYALDFQNRVLSANLPINMVVTAGTHNSFNTRSDGYGSLDNVIRKGFVLHIYCHYYHRYYYF